MQKETVTTTLLLILLLSGCCEYKHDAQKNIELLKQCYEVDQSLTVDYCQRIAEEGSRIGGCDVKN